MPNVQEQFETLHPSLQKFFQKPENASIQKLVEAAGLNGEKVSQPLLIQELKKHDIVASVTDLSKIHIIAMLVDGEHDLDTGYRP